MGTPMWDGSITRAGSPSGHDPAPVSDRAEALVAPAAAAVVREGASAGRRPSPSLRRARFGDVGVDHLRAGEEEAEHQVARDTLDAVPVDERMLTGQRRRCLRVGR